MKSMFKFLDRFKKPPVTTVVKTYVTVTNSDGQPTQILASQLDRFQADLEAESREAAKLITTGTIRHDS